MGVPNKEKDMDQNNTKPTAYAATYLDELRANTPGNTDIDKMTHWQKEDDATCMMQTRITALRVLMGMVMLDEYGNPGHSEKQAKRKEVAEKHGMKLRRAYDYMNAAAAVKRATGLHEIEEGTEGAGEGLMLPLDVFAREVQEVPLYVDSWLAKENLDDKNERLVDTATVPLPPAPKPPKPERVVTRKNWEKASEKLLTNLPVVNDATLLCSTLRNLRQQVDRKLMDVEGSPWAHPEEGLRHEIDSLLTRILQREEEAGALLTTLECQLRETRFAWMQIVRPIWHAQNRAKCMDALEAGKKAYYGIDGNGWVTNAPTAITVQELTRLGLDPALLPAVAPAMVATVIVEKPTSETGVLDTPEAPVGVETATDELPDEVAPLAQEEVVETTPAEEVEVSDPSVEEAPAAHDDIFEGIDIDAELARAIEEDKS